MKLRLSGTPGEVTAAVTLLRQVLHVEYVSPVYGNRQRPGVRVYLDVHVPPAGSTR